MATALERLPCKRSIGQPLRCTLCVGTTAQLLPHLQGSTPPRTCEHPVSGARLHALGSSRHSRGAYSMCGQMADLRCTTPLSSL